MYKDYEPHFELNGTIERESEKAILVSFFELPALMWMPKSQIKVINGIIFANDWLVREKFGDKLYIKMREARTEGKRAEERRRDFEKNGRDIERATAGGSVVAMTEFPDRLQIVAKSKEHYGYDRSDNQDVKKLVAHGFDRKSVLSGDDQWFVYTKTYASVDEMQPAFDALVADLNTETVATEAAAETVAPMSDMDRTKIKDMNEVVVRFEDESGVWTVRGKVGKLKDRLFARMFLEGGAWIIEGRGGERIGEPMSSERAGHRRLLDVAGEIADDILCLVIR